MTYRKALMLADGLVFAGVVLALAMLLSGCGGIEKASPVQIPPKAADPQICAKIPDEPKPAGGVVRPITPEEIAAWDRFNDYEVDHIWWGREGWRVVGVAQRQFCR